MRKRVINETDYRDPFTVKTYHGAVGGTPASMSAPLTLRSGGIFASPYKQIDDVVTPGYREKRKAGAVIMNPMALQCVTDGTCKITFMAGPWSTWYNGGYELYEGDIAQYFSSVPVPTNIFEQDVPTMKELALVKAYAKMNAAPVCGGEIAHDLSKTVGMLKRPFSGAYDLLRRMAKSRKQHLGKTTRSATKATAGVWLEYRYGWKPLLGDAQTIIDEVHSIHDRLSRPRRLVARASEGGEDYNLTSPFEVSIYSPLKAVGDVHVSGQERVHAGVVYEAKPQTRSQELRRMLGTRIQDIPSTLWEITPYSFVVDWFVNVGPWLQAVTPNPSVSVLGNWVTYVSRRSVSYSGKLTYTWNGTFTGSFPTLTNSRDYVERTVGNPLPSHPILTAKKLSRFQTADAVSLIAGKVLGLLRDFRH